MRIIVFLFLYLSLSVVANAREQHYCEQNFLDKCVDGDVFYSTAKRIFLGENIARYCNIEKQVIIYEQYINEDKKTYAKGEEYAGYVCVFKQKYPSQHYSQ